jgi:drug/metabolite transporter (DMT)-like permease
MSILNKSNRKIGLAMIIIGAALWGLSGPMIQWFLHQTGLSSSDYLVVRMLLSGLIILSYLFITKKDIFGIWKQPKDVVQLIIFTIIGMLLGQYVFVETVRISNAVTATLFQFLGPVLITIYVAINSRKLPTNIQFLSIVAALMGTFFLITNGKLAEIVLTRDAIMFGVFTALTFAIYTIQPARLIKKWGSTTMVGWGMLLGGFVLWLFHREFSFAKLENSLSVVTAMILLLIIISGTLSFILYFGSLKYLSPTETGILSSIEPLVAAVVSIIWLKEMFGFYQLIGGIFIVVAVIFLSIPERGLNSKQVKSKAS